MTTENAKEKLRLIDWIIIVSVVVLFFTLHAMFPEFFQEIHDRWYEITSRFHHGEPGWIRIR